MVNRSVVSINVFEICFAGKLKVFAALIVKSSAEVKYAMRGVEKFEVPKNTPPAEAFGGRKKKR